MMITSGTVKNVIVLLFCINVAATASFLPLDLEEVFRMWRDRLTTTSGLVEWKLEDEASAYALPRTDCNGPCQYPLFEYTAPNYDPVADATVLVVSGFHGDEKLGVWISSYAFPYLKGKHVLYLPVVNPSGYAHNTREEFPSRIDPNRDFPFDSDSDSCMRGVASRLMDYVYRKWKIDMSITIHQGGDEIAWNWGNPSFVNQVSVDSDIYTDIGRQLQRKAGSNRLYGMKELRVGSMNSIIYPASGSFQDWAYAASWVSYLTPKCKAYSYSPYPEDMNNGLVYIFESATSKYLPASALGTEEGIEQPPTASTAQNGFVPRGIRLLRELLSICYPQLHCWKHQTEQKLVFKVEGCATVKLLLSIGDLVYKSQLNGSLSGSPSFTEFEWKYADPNGTGSAKIDYQFICDKKWLDLGRSRFGKGRLFRGELNLQWKKTQIIAQPIPSLFDRADLPIAICTGLTVMIVIACICWQHYGRSRQPRANPGANQTEDSIGSVIDTQKELNLASSDNLVVV